TVMTVSEHLHNMMLLYSDASAIALAKAHSGSEEAFVKAMNDKAAQLSMTGTVFASSDGHDSTGNAKTTAQDLYKLMRHAMRLNLFREISATVEFTLPTGADGTTRNFTSRNHLLSKYTYSSYLYSNAVAGFISYSESGTSFIAVCDNNGRNLYALVLNTPDDGTQVYLDAINLAEHGYNSYQSVILAKKGTYLQQIPLKSAIEADAVLVTDRDVSALLPIGYKEEDVTLQTTVPEYLKAPLKAGDSCGTAQYFYQGRPLVTCALVAEKDIKSAPLGWILRLFSKFNTWLVLVIIVAVSFPLYSHYKRAKRREELKRRKREIMGNDKQGM
ncbi:MAG: D-alanyl-D-alanine carboxypeptidase, partial [Clostridia bacterium]|nr:D-alanyl-D-alanine carboxypeptidase [Clostridia bacterium]